MISLPHYLAIGAVLFVIGLVGFLTRRNMIVMFLCAEMMLQGVAINFVSFARYHANLHGQVMTLFIITVAACEAALAMALFVMLYRKRKSLDISLWQDLREPGQEPTIDTDPLPVAPPVEDMPKLPVAGREPVRSSEDRTFV